MVFLHTYKEQANLWVIYKQNLALNIVYNQKLM